MQNDRNGGTVVVLGGGGGMGAYAARAAAALDGVGRVIVADRDHDAAGRVARACGPQVEPRLLDVANGAELRATLTEADIAMNAVGPFFRFGPAILRAAIEARCDYVDLCDDPEPTVEMLQMSAAAADAGVRAVVGMGASPGIVNLLAAVAVGELDEVTALLTGWNGEGASPEPDSGPAAIEHGIAQATGKIPVVREGRRCRERPLRRVVVDYPGLGRRPARTFGHPEPLTLQRSFDTVDTLLNVAHGRARFVLPLLLVARLCDRGILSFERAARLAERAERAMPSPPLAALASPRRLPPLFALASGVRNGEPAAVGVALAALPGVTMGAVTGVPMAVAGGMMLRGAELPPGVHPPESVLGPRLFFAALAPHCPGAVPVGETLLLTRSWDSGARDVYRSGLRAARRRHQELEEPTPDGDPVAT